MLGRLLSRARSVLLRERNRHVAEADRVAVFVTGAAIGAVEADVVGAADAPVTVAMAVSDTGDGPVNDLPIAAPPAALAHRRTVTASMAMDLPGLDYCEPAYAAALEWLLFDGLDRLPDPTGRSLYLRPTTRIIDQRPFADAVVRDGVDRIRADVLAGGYRLHTPLPSNPVDVILVACGAVMPEAVLAVAQLADEGVSALLIDVTSIGRLFGGWRASQRTAINNGRLAATDFQLATLIRNDERRAPLVTIHDAASHTMAWMGSVFGQRTVPVGFEVVGHSESDAASEDWYEVLPGLVVNAALVALDNG